MDITISKGGTAERTVSIEEIEVPDVWEVVQFLQSHKSTKAWGDSVMETWVLANALLKTLQQVT